MSSYIQKELFLLLYALGTGCFLKLVYDILIIMRNTVIHKKRLIDIQDFLFWLFAGILIFIGIYIENQGNLRLFFILGVILGAVIWNMTVSKKIIHFVTKILLSGMGFLGNAIKRLLFCGRRCKISLLKIVKRIRKMKKRLVRRGGSIE